MDKYALIIACQFYDDPAIANLEKAHADAEGIKRVLLDRELANFDDVEILQDPSFFEARIKIQSFFEGRKISDILFLYFAGHGVINEADGLSLLFRDSRKNAYEATALEFDFIRRRRDYCVSKKNILVFDSCFSGRIHGRSGDHLSEELDKFAKIDIGQRNISRISQYTISSTSKTLKSWEYLEEAHRYKTNYSIFASHFIHGFTHPRARDNHGHLSIDSLFKFVEEKVTSDTSGKQQPYSSHYGGGYITLVKGREDFSISEHISTAERHFEEAVKKVSKNMPNDENIKRRLSDVSSTAQRVKIIQKLLSANKDEQAPFDVNTPKNSFLHQEEHKENRESSAFICFLLSIFRKVKTARSALCDELNRFLVLEFPSRRYFNSLIASVVLFVIYENGVSIPGYANFVEDILVKINAYIVYEADPVSLKKHWLYFDIHPSDSQVTLLPSNQQVDSPVMLKSGQYEFEISHPRFVTDTITVTVDEDTTYRHTLETLKEYTLFINTVPKLAKVQLDGKDMGTINQLTLSSGEYQIRLSKEKFLPATLNLDLMSNKHVEVVLKNDRHMEVFRDKLSDGSLGPALVYLRGGTYQIGFQKSNYGQTEDERPFKKVSVPDFAIGKYEVTFEEYDRFAKLTDREMPYDEQWGRDKMPVINVNWRDAIDYTRWLSKKTGHNYRLPTEAEWEYAARGNKKTLFFTGDCLSSEDANFNDNITHTKRIGCTSSNVYLGATRVVGSYKSNDFGLKDMFGNVWEWNKDCWDDHTKKINQSSEKCIYVSARGGSWKNRRQFLRLANRGRFKAIEKSDHLGFRVLREITEMGQ